VSPEQFREAIAALGMNQREAAMALEVDERTVRKWALGERAIPGPARVALRFMAALRFGNALANPPHNRHGHGIS
jgi:DNA-binding transcriptional regulator YiaG